MENFTKIRITLDPGHFNGYNMGNYKDSTTGKSYYEGAVVFAIAKFLKAELEKFGIFEVFITRTEDDDMSLSKRCAIALTNGSRMMLALHTNAFNGKISGNKYVTDGTACGTEVLCSSKRKEYVNVATALTKIVADTLNAATGITKCRPPVFKMNATGTADYYGSMRYAVEKPGIEHVYLIEHGYHDNPIEARAMYATEMQKKLASAIARYCYELLAPIYINPTTTKLYTGKTTTGLNVRTKPNESALLLGTIPANGEIRVVGVSDGWCKVSYNNCISYASAKYISLPPDFGKDASADTPPIIAPPVNKPITPPATDKNMLRVGYVTITAKTALCVRTRPDTEAEYIRQLPQGTRVLVDLNHSTATWYALYGYPSAGYIINTYAKLDMSSLSELPANETDVVEPSKMITGVVNTSAGLNVRTRPYNNSAIITALPYKSTVNIRAIENGWAELDDGTFVSAKYLDLNDESTDAIPVRCYMVTANAVNVRKGPGTSHTVVGSLTYGSTINAISEEHGWIKFSNTKFSNCYCFSQYLTKTTMSPVYENSIYKLTDSTMKALAGVISNRNITASKWFSALGYTKLNNFSYRVNVAGVQQFHPGIDYSAPGGTPIICPVTGVCSEKRYDQHFGNLICISTIDGKSKHYFTHMKSPGLPKTGALVTRGNVIGLCGTTGGSTCNHLHYEIRVPPFTNPDTNIHPDTFDYSNYM